MSNLSSRAGWLLGIGAASALLFGSCEFDPLARPVSSRKLMDGSARVLRMLDPYGVHALVRRNVSTDERVYTISDWNADDHCELPDGLSHVFEPLAAPPSAGVSSTNVALPIGVSRGDGVELMLATDTCELRGPLGRVAPGTVLWPVTSVEDQRQFMVYRDEADTLFVYDPWRSDEPLRIAKGVNDVRSGTAGTLQHTDALWMREGGALTQRTLDGKLVVSLGDDVSAYTFAGTATLRIAYVDGGDLYEAVAPDFQPVLRARDACAPRYVSDALELLFPCEDAQLLRVGLSTGEVEEFPEGVYASFEDKGVRFDYARSNDEPDVDILYVQSEGGARTRVLPYLRRESLFVLNATRIAGQTLEGEFGLWDLPSRTFMPLFEDVSALIPLLDTRENAFIWLIHHDARDGALGKLAVFTQTDLALTPIADGVPRFDMRGYIIDAGRAIPKYPYPESIVLYLEGATRLETPEFQNATNTRFKGKLRAQLLSGALAADIAENVSSFYLVASPLPGILYGVEEGKNEGLWFAAL